VYIRNFEDLIVWQKAHELVQKVYTDKEIKIHAEENYGLKSQLRRAAVSVPANIAEGCRRSHIKETVNFLSIFAGSLSEVRYYLILCKDIGYITQDKFDELHNVCIELDKMLDRLIYKLKKQS
jgi:four helix bundle protein